MARKPTYTPPRPANLSVEDMRTGISRLKKRIEDLEAFDPNTVPERFHHSVGVLGTAIEETLARVFGKDSEEYSRYSSASRIDNGPMTLMWGEDDRRVPFRSYLKEGKERSIAKLQQAIRGLEEDIEHKGGASLPAETHPLQPTPKGEPSRTVFIVHGHDSHPREAVARFLERIGFEPIILHEQPNGGRTIIEKFEKHGDVGFAVVLLTPDDFGGANGSAPESRARQNVILELGYFIGALGRNRVCALKSGDLELPSDLLGVGWQPFDEGGGWKQALAGELQEAGYEIDWNSVMRSRKDAS
jgi:predicted nucleotide-binding protein